MHPLIDLKEKAYTDPMAPKTEDERLVAAARSGDSAAFETLVMRNKRLILAVSRRMTGNSAEAEDLSQQTFMKAFANLSSFGGRCAFSTWLVTIARNEARMWHRRAHRHREVIMSDLSIGDNEDKPVEFMDRRPNPEAAYSQKQRSDFVFSAIQQLRPRVRDTVRICDLEEQSTGAASGLLGISLSGVKSRRLRGRIALRRKLESIVGPRKRHPHSGDHDNTRKSANRQD